jgi:hypothetical protein
LRYEVTGNSDAQTPEQNADTVRFAGRPELGEIRVYEAFDSPNGLNTGAIELWGKVGSLTPLFLANTQGGMFAQAIPEPGTWALLLGGLAAVLVHTRQRRRVW